MKRLAFATAAVITVGILFVAVFPTRALLEQRRVRRDTIVQLRSLERRNGALDAAAQRLRTDSEIERLAREHYNLVRPGEEAYAMLPAPGAPDPTPSAAPPPPAGGEGVEPARRPSSGLWSRLWSKVTGIF